MKTFTYDDILALKPCYDPVKYIPKDWQGTLINILDLDEVILKDRFWVALRLLPIFEVEVFAIDCAVAAYAASASATASFDANDDARAAAAFAAYAAARAAAAFAAYAAAYANDAAYAANYASAYAADANDDAAIGTERERQLESLRYLARGIK